MKKVAPARRVTATPPPAPRTGRPLPVISKVKTTDTTNEFRRHREKLKMNQGSYWGKLGVTQSGGCRYEQGRDIPGPTRLLWELAYGNTPMKALSTLRGVPDAMLRQGK